MMRTIKNPQHGIRAQMVLKLTWQPHWRLKVKALVWIMMLAFLYKQKKLNKFHHHLDNFISFHLIYRLWASEAYLIAKLHTENWKHRSKWTVTLTLKLAGYFATHIQAREGEGAIVPRHCITVANYHMAFAMQLVDDPLINLHSNHQHLISHCCHGNKYKRIYCRFSLYLDGFCTCWRTTWNITLYAKTGE